MESIEKHIEQDKQILQDPTTNPQMRRHVEGELKELEEYVQHHKKKSKQVIITIPPTWNFTVIKTHLNQSV